MLGLSIPEFGPVASPITNGSTTPNIDAAWFVDFDDLGPTLDIDVSLIAKADAFSIAEPRVALWVSSSPTSLAGSTQIAALDVPSTGGAYTPKSASAAAVTNPGGKQYLLVVSQNGSG